MEFWAGIGAMCALLTLLGGMLAVFLRHVKLMMQVELSMFLGQLDKTYIRVDAYQENYTELERRVTEAKVEADRRIVEAKMESDRRLTLLETAIVGRCKQGGS